MKLIETYNGVEIHKEKDLTDPRPFVTVEKVPVLGVLQTGHKTLEDAKKYIDRPK